MLTLLPVAPLSVIPVTANAPVLLVKLRLPLVELIPLKLVTKFVAVFNRVPVEELVVNKPPVIMPEEVWVIWPLLAVKLTALVPAFNAPVKLIAPDVFVFVILTLLPVAPLSVIPVTANEPVLSVKLMLPLVVLAPLKLVTAFVAVFNKVPVPELVVSKPPVTTPLLLWLI